MTARNRQIADRENAPRRKHGGRSFYRKVVVYLEWAHFWWFSTFHSHLALPRPRLGSRHLPVVVPPSFVLVQQVRVVY